VASERYGKSQGWQYKVAFVEGWWGDFWSKPRKYKFPFPRRMRKKALAVVLSERAKEGKIKIVENTAIDKPKTKEVFNILKKFGVESLKTLVVSGSEDKNHRLAIRNLPKAKYAHYTELNIFDVLNSECLLIFKEAADKFGEFLKR
jgi:large subunit ribosomal protein L4